MVGSIPPIPTKLKFNMKIVLNIQERNPDTFSVEECYKIADHSLPDEYYEMRRKSNLGLISLEEFTDYCKKLKKDTVKL
jgi:hypothetical protein